MSKHNESNGLLEPEQTTSPPARIRVVDTPPQNPTHSPVRAELGALNQDLATLFGVAASMQASLKDILRPAPAGTKDINQTDLVSSSPETTFLQALKDSRDMIKELTAAFGNMIQRLDV